MSYVDFAIPGILAPLRETPFSNTISSPKVAKTQRKTAKYTLSQQNNDSGHNY